MSHNQTIDFTNLTAEQHTHLWVALSLNTFSLLVSCVPLYFYTLHTQRRLIWSHYNNLLVGCILMQWVQSLARSLATTVLLSGAMDKDICRSFASIDAALDPACAVLLLGFYYSLMAVRWNPIRKFARLLCSPCGSPDVWYRHFRHFGWFGLSASVAAVTASYAATQGEGYGFVLGWCTEMGSPWLFFATTVAPLALLVLSAIQTMITLRCCVRGDGGRGIARELTWKHHWTVYVRFFAVIVFVLAAMLSTIVLHFLLQNDDRDERRDIHSYIPVILLSLWPTILSFTFLLTEGTLHYLVQKLHACAGTSEHETDESKLLVDGNSGGYAAYNGPKVSLPYMARGGVEERCESEYGTADTPSPRQPHGVQHAPHAHETDMITGGINNFTAAVEALLSLEAVGNLRYASIADQQEQDRRLGVATLGPGVSSGVYDERQRCNDDDVYSEPDDSRLHSASLADGFTPPARSVSTSNGLAGPSTRDGLQQTHP